MHRLSLEVGVARKTTSTRDELSEICCGESARGSVLEVNEASGPCGEFSLVSTRQK